MTPPPPVLLWALAQAAKRPATSPYSDYRYWLRQAREKKQTKMELT